MSHPAVRRRASIALLLIAGLASAAGAAPPESTSALIGEQLDKLVKLQFTNAALPQVLSTIEQQTGVPVRVTDDVYATLPWGTHTPITATVEGLTLRDALTAISGKLGLRFDVKQEAVELSPLPALRRMNRRATLQELRTLDLLASHKLPAPSNANGWTLATLSQAIDGSLVEIDKQLVAQKQPPAKLVLEMRSTQGADPAKSPVLVPRDATLADGLDAIAGQTKLTWYPWGDSVVVLPKHDVIAARLERTASLRYDGVDLAQVLIDLSRQAGTEFAVEPGAIQRVPPEFRIIRLNVDAATVRQALDTLQGATGLGYVVNDDGVYLWNQNSNPAAAGRGRVAATIEVAPGTNVLVYEDQLSQHARDALNTRRDEGVAKLEATLTGKPATQPTEAAN